MAQRVKNLISIHGDTLCMCVRALKRKACVSCVNVCKPPVCRESVRWGNRTSWPVILRPVVWTQLRPAGPS